MESDELILPKNILEVHENDDVGVGYDDDFLEEDDIDFAEQDRRSASLRRRTALS